MDHHFNLFDTSDYSENNEEAVVDSKEELISDAGLVIVHDDKTGIQRRDLCEDITPDHLPESLDELELQIDRLKQRWGEFTYLIGQRLKYISDQKLFESKGYPDFKTYVQIALKMSENNAYYYIAIFEYFTEDQTRQAGSKLKLIIPILNRIRKDPQIPGPIKEQKLIDLRDELFLKVLNKTYREAEKIIQEMRSKFFTEIEKIEEFKRITLKDDKIIIHEPDKEIQKELYRLISDFYE